MNIVAMIPARMGSERLPVKNLALINGAPLISYAINAAKNSGVFSKVVVNSDGDVFKGIAERYDVDFYLRPPELGSSETKSDDVVFDFMLKHPSDIVVWVNPTAPLQPGEEIAEVVNYFVQEKLDSLITVKNEQYHGLYEGNPLNFIPEELFAKTQDLVPVQIFVYSIMMWRSGCFMKNYRSHGHALMSGKLGYFPVGKHSQVNIKNEEDLMIAENLIKSGVSEKHYEVLYDDLAPRRG